MPCIEIQPGDASSPDQRHPVRRHRPEPAPAGWLSVVVGRGRCETLADRDEVGDALVVFARVEASEIGETGEPQP